MFNCITVVAVVFAEGAIVIYFSVYTEDGWSFSYRDVRYLSDSGDLEGPALEMNTSRPFDIDTKGSKAAAATGFFLAIVY